MSTGAYEFEVNGVHYSVSMTQRESAISKYRKMDDHGLLGMVNMIRLGTMTDREKIAAVNEVLVERGIHDMSWVHGKE